jgi:hypothetical protein
MNKSDLLTLNDDQVEQIVAAHHKPGHINPPPLPCPQVSTLACGEEGPCSGC